MIIKVKSPGDCPMRYLDGVFVCALVGSVCWQMPCKNDEEFPNGCPLNSRTVIVKKEEAEAAEPIPAASGN